MAGGLQAAWARLGTLGASGQSAHERRRIAVLNRALFLGITASVGYIPVYLAAGALRAALVNLAFIAGYAAAFAATLRAHHRLARHLAMLSANGHIFCLSVLVLGEASGVHRWFWMFIVVTFLVFTRQEKRACYGYSALSIALFTVIEHGLIEPRGGAVISAGVASVISVISTIATLAVITVIVDLFDRETGRAERALASEHERSESLLLNILPRSIASRLKSADERPQPIADSYREVTVLFADLANFTPMSDALDPREVVALLNDVFSDFDKLAEKYQLEKIKTIGDAYMVAGGLPEPMPDHARAVAEMALDMVEVTRRRRGPGGGPLQIRIGVNSGPVVAGVIGVKKFIYDLWGDTVNTASRMESHGVIGSIQVTAETYELLRDDYTFEPRGPIEVKGKGAMTTYIMTGRKKPQQLVALR